MAVVWDKAMFDLAYEFNAEPMGHPNTRPAIKLHYNKYVMYPELVRRAQAFIDLLGLTLADKILIVGCGFGWTVEILQGMGYTVVGADVSPYIQGAKAQSEDTEIADAITAAGLNPASGEGMVHFNRLKGDGIRTKVDVLDEDSSSNRSRNKIKNILGTPTVIITEDVVTSLTDSECQFINDELIKYDVAARVVHFLTEFANPDAPFFFNSKSLAEWKALFPDANVIADGYTYRML